MRPFLAVSGDGEVTGALWETVMAHIPGHIPLYVCMCVCTCACVHVCACVCTCVCFILCGQHWVKVLESVCVVICPPVDAYLNLLWTALNVFYEVRYHPVVQHTGALTQMIDIANT